MVEVPSARAASSRARWEMDLSPGTARVPDRGSPPSTEMVPAPASGGPVPVVGGTAHRMGPTGVLVAR